MKLDWSNIRGAGTGPGGKEKTSGDELELPGSPEQAGLQTDNLFFSAARSGRERQDRAIVKVGP